MFVSIESRDLQPRPFLFQDSGRRKASSGVHFFTSVSGVPFRNAVEGTPETKTETSDGGRTAPGAERGKDRDRLGAELWRLAGAWRGPCKWSDQSRPVSVCRSGAEARLIVFREAETGSRAAGRRGANPAKRDCAANVCDARDMPATASIQSRLCRRSSVRHKCWTR